MIYYKLWSIYDPLKMQIFANSIFKKKNSNEVNWHIF
jgi:hypothetical protein